jgi:hypothetical protein
LALPRLVISAIWLAIRLVTTIRPRRRTLGGHAISAPTQHPPVRLIRLCSESCGLHLHENRP